MIAVHLESGTVTIEEQPIPVRRPDFALIRLLVAGICNTDLELQRGYYGFSGTPGHEFVGEVVDADRSALMGRRVVGEINLACGHCDFCSIGLGRHCVNRTVLGIVKHPGAFAEYLTLPEKNLYIVPDEVPVEQAVFVEPLAAACEILDQIRIRDGEPVAVLGDGKLGLLIAQVLQAHGAHVKLYGRHEGKLRIAESVGIAVSRSPDEFASAYSIVVEATGRAEGLKQAAKMVRPRGTIVMKSTVHGEVALDMSAIIVNEVTLVGSRCGRFEPAIDLLQANRIELQPLLAGEFALAEAPAAFEEAGRRGVLKVLLRNEG